MWEGLGGSAGETAGPSSGTSHSGGNGVEPRIKWGDITELESGESRRTRTQLPRVDTRPGPVLLCVCSGRLWTCACVGGVRSCLPARLHRPPPPYLVSNAFPVCSLCAAEGTRPPALPFPALQRFEQAKQGASLSPGLAYSLCHCLTHLLSFSVGPGLPPPLDKFCLGCTGCSPPPFLPEKPAQFRRETTCAPLCVLSASGAAGDPPKARARGQNTPISASLTWLSVPVSFFPFL